MLAKKAPRMQATLAERIWTALGEQTVVVAGTTAAEANLPKQAAALAGLLDQRKAMPPTLRRSSMTTLLPGS